MPVKKLIYLACSIALACLIVGSPSSAQNSVAKTDPVYPVGSATWFFSLTAWSDSAPDIGEFIPATVKNTRLIQRQLDKPPKTPPEGTPKPIGTWTYHFTTTVWSDGTTENGPLTIATERSVQQILDRLEAQEPLERSSSRGTVIRPPTQKPAVVTATAQENRPGKTAGPFPPGGMCRAKTVEGQRCRRAAKGDTGRCGQHQSSDIEFND